MNGQLWSWVLTAIGLTGFFLAGRKVWWCWYVNILNQVVWLAYSLITKQYGFLVGTFAYSFVFVKNAIAWTKEHNQKKSRIDAILYHDPSLYWRHIEELRNRNE